MQENTNTTELKIHSKFKPLFTNQYVRYGFYGGRGSGKSYAVATYAVLTALQQKEKILTIRKFQNSLRKSSFDVYKEQISFLNLDKYFKIKDLEITCLATGSEFFFMGVDRNIGSIKSTNNITLTIVEEDQDISKISFDIVNKTVLRTPKSRIVYVWNPFLPSDPVDEYFRGAIKPKKSYSVMVNWQDNSYITENMLDEIETDKLKDIDLYKHAWEGDYATISRLLIFNNWEIGICALDTCTIPTIGVDFGYTDENTAVLVYMLGGTIYIAKEIKQGGISTMFNNVLLDMIPKEFPNTQLICDSASPNSIEILKNEYFLNAVGAKKGANSVLEGIRWLQAKKIIIHPDCKEMIKEAQSYCWQTDKNGILIDKPRDSNNHLWDAVRYAVEPERLRKKLNLDITSNSLY